MDTTSPAPYERSSRLRIYLAARYSRRGAMVKYADLLRQMGHVVTSRWLDGSHESADKALVESDAMSPEAILLRQQFAYEDIEDLERADLLIAFTEPPSSGASRGGRHVEYGIALAYDKSIVVVGPRENLFHWLPQVHVFDSFSAARHSLATEHIVCANCLARWPVLVMTYEDDLPICPVCRKDVK